MSATTEATTEEVEQPTEAQVWAIAAPTQHTVPDTDASEPGGTRFVWFMAGVAAAVAAAGIAAIAFLAISGADDDGSIELDVPAVEVDVTP